MPKHHEHRQVLSGKQVHTLSTVTWIRLLRKLWAWF